MNVYHVVYRTIFGAMRTKTISAYSEALARIECMKNVFCAEVETITQLQ